MRSITGILLVCLAALAASGCFVTETEIVSAAQSVRLLGARFVHDDYMAHRETVFTWNEVSRGYLSEDRSSLVRFGHLRDEAYIAQVRVLRNPSPEPGSPPITGTPHGLVLVRVSPPRVHVQFPECLGLKDETPRLAIGYGLDYRDSPMAAVLRGSRAGILGFFVAGLECHSGASDIRIVPESLTPGGPELAPAAAKYDRANFVPVFTRACDGGDVENCYKLGQVYARGEGVPVDAARAATFFERACNAKDMRGCLDLGLLYERGTGVNRDAARATELITRACSNGEPYACEMLKRTP